MSCKEAKRTFLTLKRNIMIFLFQESVLEVKINLYAEFQPPSCLGSGSSPPCPSRKLRWRSWLLGGMLRFFILGISFWSQNKSACWISASQLTSKWPVSNRSSKMSSKEAKRTFLTPWQENLKKDLMPNQKLPTYPKMSSIRSKLTE